MPKMFCAVQGKHKRLKNFSKFEPSALVWGLWYRFAIKRGGMDIINPQKIT